MGGLLLQASPDPILTWLTQGGAIGVLAFIVFAFLKGWIVTGSELRKVETERDRALELVYRQANISSRAVDSQLDRLDLDRELRELREASKRSETGGT